MARIDESAVDDRVALARVPTEAAEQPPIGATLLARRPGVEGGSAAPVLLMAHRDVVPAPPAGWTHPPHSGHRDETHVWGRGTLDDKGSLVGLCVEVEALLADGFAPARDVWLLFGDDEATMGTGAASAFAVLEAAGVRPASALDEGGDRVRRFAPCSMTREERLTLHARGERIRVDTWLDGCRWHADLIERSCR